MIKERDRFGGSSSNVSAGLVRRFGPMLKRNGMRTPMRGNKTGSVMMLIPKKLMRTVEWPSQDAVSWSLLHSLGRG